MIRWPEPPCVRAEVSSCAIGSLCGRFLVCFLLRAADTIIRTPGVRYALHCRMYRGFFLPCSNIAEPRPPHCLLSPPSPAGMTSRLLATLPHLSPPVCSTNACCQLCTQPPTRLSPDWVCVRPGLPPLATPLSPMTPLLPPSRLAGCVTLLSLYCMFFLLPVFFSLDLLACVSLLLQLPPCIFQPHWAHRTHEGSLAQGLLG